MDPSAFMANQGQFNPAAAAAGGQFANPQQMAAAMQNGPMRNTSPSFQNPVYQTNSIIPSKRPRPREDSMGASPRQNPGMLPTSRADTPQQSQFPGFQPNAMQQQHPGQPQQYPHLQPNGSANASPSPVMAGNQLRPGSVPQRVNTASPHPFSPASQQFAPQASPVPSEHGGTPQPNPYMQNQNFPPGFNPNYAPSSSPARPPSTQNPMAPQMMPQQMGQMPQQMQQMQQMHPNQMAQIQQMQQMQQMQQQMQQAGRGMDPAAQQKMLYQMRLQQQLQGNVQMAQVQQAQAQNMAVGRGMMPKQGMPMPNGQMPPGAMPPQQPQVPRGTNPESFMKNLTTFMSVHNLPLDTNPTVEGRPLHLMQLFMMTSKFGYYRTVTQRGLWPQVATAIGFNQAQFPSAPGQIKNLYERSLLKFEDAWRKQKGGQPMGNPPGMVGQPGPQTPQRMGQQPPMAQGQPPMQAMQPMQPMQPGQQPQMPQPHVQTPVKQMAPGMQQVNGFSTPQQAQMPQQPPNAAQGHMRSSMPRSIDATPTGEFPMQSPSSVKTGPVPMQMPPGQPDGMQANGATAHPFPPPLADNQDEYVVSSREMNIAVYGGSDLSSLAKLGSELEQWRPDIPPPLELGWIDLQALTRSIQSGIHGEIRLALDTLATVTHEAGRNPALTIDLRGCDDLMESLIDCAEEQVDILAEGTKPVSDEIDLTSYEEIMRQCRAEQCGLRKVTIFGAEDYVLDHAADRLIAITTILRNLSFHEPNHELLADEVVVKFLCSTIRSLGTLEALLRSPRNALDFMKDVILLLSNIAGSIELPGKEQAFCLLQFLLAFAPSPAPTMASGRILFAPFEPAIHLYLPHAVDALAKLLARDEPNRSHYKAIFAADAACTPPCELLTRTFGLAICCLPDQNKDSRPANLPSFVEARKPVIMQGLLAADILASLAPGYESGVTKAWLSSSEGFAQNLFKLVRALCHQAEPTPPQGRGNTRAQPREDTDLPHIISWGVSLLRRLCEKSRDPSDPSSIPANALPTKESIFSAFQTLKNPKWAHLLNQLSSYAGLDE